MTSQTNRSPYGEKPSDRIIRFFPLASRVLVVAVDRPHDGETCWTAYIDAVPGQSHKREAAAVADAGDKAPEAVARALFPDLIGPYID